MDEQKCIRLDEQEELPSGQQDNYEKPHNDLVTTRDQESSILNIRLLEVKQPFSDQVKQDIAHMKKVFAELVEDKIAVGIAAQQLGMTTRICAVLINKKQIIMVNPKIIGKSKSTKFSLEGCLSIPGALVRVRRPKEVTVKYLDENGDEQIYKSLFSRYSARICHELSHLNGELLTDYLEYDRRGRPTNVTLDWSLLDEN